MITSEMIDRRVQLVRKGGLILAVLLGLVIAVGRSNVYVEASDMLASGVTTDATVLEEKYWTEKGKKGRQLDRYALGLSLFFVRCSHA